MHAERIFPTTSIPTDLEVVSASYVATGAVDVIIESVASGDRWMVHFENAEGMRILDERDLLEFWPTCSRPNGCLFRIRSGGWLEQESRREGFLLRDTTEYFVAGIDMCVSVFSFAAPEISKT